MTEGITVPADAMKGVVVKAILDTMDTDTRDKIMEQAVAHLLNSKQDPRSFAANSPTVLQAAANDAMRLAAGDVVREFLKEGPWAERLKEEVQAALTSLFNEEGGSEPIRQAVSRGLSEYLETRWR